MPTSHIFNTQCRASEDYAVKKHLKLIVFFLWALLIMCVIGPLTPSYFSGGLAAGGTVFLMNLTSRYQKYGNQGLKFWKRMPPDP